MLRSKRPIVFMGIVAFFVPLLLVVISSVGQGYVPPEGFVPDKETAIRIAVAVWIPIYGKDSIDGQAPYTAQLVNETWAVQGTLPPNTDGSPSPGGVAHAAIRKKDGCILQVFHGK